jgi:hypothetical protein
MACPNNTDRHASAIAAVGLLMLSCNAPIAAAGNAVMPAATVSVATDSAVGRVASSEPAAVDAALLLYLGEFDDDLDPIDLQALPFDAQDEGAPRAN